EANHDRDPTHAWFVTRAGPECRRYSPSRGRCPRSVPLGRTFPERERDVIGRTGQAFCTYYGPWPTAASPVSLAGVASARGLDRDALAPVCHAAVVVVGRRDVGGADDRRRRVIARVLREAEADASEPAVRVAAEHDAVGRHAKRALQGVARDVSANRRVQLLRC